MVFRVKAAFRLVSAALLGIVLCGPVSAAEAFHLQEATIADVHRAMLAKQLTAQQLVGYYLKRIEAYNGRCVNGAVDPQPDSSLAMSSRRRRPASSTRS
jgi:Asp-tRNA(Asn)/Glu-tRNA(Gln) amidotransferase A subunit family amidase